VQNRSRNIEPKRSAPDLKLKDREAPLPDPQREAEHELLQRYLQLGPGEGRRLTTTRRSVPGDLNASEDPIAHIR
jgi:hypothetical protein